MKARSAKRSAGENIFVFKRPLGVTTGILPWNFPFFLIARKLAPALTGNTIVIKPSEFTPITPSLLRRSCMTSVAERGL
jgi:acyl-CoA reductase-like NAD-dependent aldehyde dehydrogenase